LLTHSSSRDQFGRGPGLNSTGSEALALVAVPTSRSGRIGPIRLTLVRNL
jgi:hypothetical protein